MQKGVLAVMIQNNELIEYVSTAHIIFIFGVSKFRTCNLRISGHSFIKKATALNMGGMYEKRFI